MIDNTLFIEYNRIGSSLSVFHFNCLTSYIVYIKNYTFINNHYIIQYYNHAIEIIYCIVDEFTCDTAKGTLITKKIIIRDSMSYSLPRSMCYTLKLVDCTKRKQAKDMIITPLVYIFLLSS